MNRPSPAADPHAQIPATLVPTQGWHTLHVYWRWDRAALAAMSVETRARGRREFLEALDPAGADAPARLQTGIVAGHKGDFSAMLMDPDPLKIDAVLQRLAASGLGPAIVPTYSFVSISEISEYVPTVEQYSARLVAEGDPIGTPVHAAKLKAYEQRLPIMNRQRLTPDFPDWPVMCFYPMNKKRKVGENWFLLPFSERNRLMAEHARSGMHFMGKVSQLITVGVGIEDWEWGVTLWGRNPEFLTEIVYRMRYDEASARYAEFGPFYTSFVAGAERILEHCRIV
ncbi:MAG TPA: heme-dependent peroxidase [Pirellulaceae bacterium]|nr:heme-dependent peroxidase [Pirellulaceae bacterium]